MVPLDLRTEEHTENGAVVREMTLVSFGTSEKVAQRLGIARYSFSNAEQEREWALLAAEGALMDVTHRIRSLNLNQTARMLAFGRTWTIEEFGYTEEDFRDDLQL